MKLQKKVTNGEATSDKTYNIEECLDKIIGINGTASEINQKLDKVSGIAAGAEVNQKAFSNVKIGSTTIAADSKTDTLNIVAGSNIILTPDATNNKITIATTNTPTFTNLTTTNLTTKGEVEIYGAQPHIDFHYNNSTDDYTSRIIESASGKVDVLAANGLFSNGKKVALKSDLATSNITLTVNDNQLKDFSYTAKYVPTIPAVFVRIYGVVNVEMNPGYDYDIINIGSNSPNYVTALSIKSAKNVSAVAKSSGVISIRPLETNIKTSAIYIAGFWFV